MASDRDTSDDLYEFAQAPVRKLVRRHQLAGTTTAKRMRSTTFSWPGVSGRA